MNRIKDFLRSMRFGIILLALVAACSVIGTVIPQGREIAWYAQNYGGFHAAIIILRLYDIFHSWYFIAIMLLLGVNLTLCSLLRISKVTSAAQNESARAANMPDTVRLTPEGVELLRDHMQNMRCRVTRVGCCEVLRQLHHTPCHIADACFRGGRALSADRDGQDLHARRGGDDGRRNADKRVRFSHRG